MRTIAPGLPASRVKARAAVITIDRAKLRTASHQAGVSAPVASLQRFVTTLLLTFGVLLAFAAKASADTSSVKLTSDGVLMQYNSATESVSYEWTEPSHGSKSQIGTLTMTRSVSGTSQGSITLTPVLTGLQGGLYFQSATLSSPLGQPTMVLTYINPLGTTHLTVVPVFEGNVATFQLTADNPSIYSLDLGSWPAQYTGRDISVPYYTKSVRYFDTLDVFANAYLDPFASNASTQTVAGTSSAYGAKTDGTYNVLKDVIKLAESGNIVSVLPVVHHAASPYMQQQAGRMVMDIKTGTFQTIANQLSALGDYGINNCVVLVHTWQQWGYDNGLPGQYPANMSLGGPVPMTQIGQIAAKNSCYFGLHENYTDFDPDYAGYTAAATMLNANGTQLDGYLNPATNVQAFVTKPNLFVKYASTQSPEIHGSYGTNSTFLDVNSSAEPWWRSDRDAAAPSSGSYKGYVDGVNALFTYERQLNNGPVYGEGRAHWFWSGALDGVEAQFGAETTPITDGTKAPLFVDFDLTRIHPLQVNYGMGFYARWTVDKATISTTTQLDAYRMQEVIFGHAPYLTDAMWSSIPRALLEQNLVSPVAHRYAQQTPKQISYFVDGAWTDTSSAAKAADFSVAQVTYTNGDTFMANSGASTLTWNGLQVPQYGWAAYGKNLAAYTALKGGSIVDYAATGTSIYANARNQADLLSSTAMAQPQMLAVTQLGTRHITLQLTWAVINPITTQSYQAFVHFVPTSNPALTSGVVSYTPAPATNGWVTGQQVNDSTREFWLPPTMTDGTYSVMAGLFSGAQRATLWGNDDGTQRYQIGTLTVANAGASITFQPVPVTIANPDPRMNSAGTLVDFDDVRTDGMVFLRSGTGTDANVWTLRSFPRSRDVAIQVKSSMLSMPSALNCDKGVVITPTTIDGGSYWQVDLRGTKWCSWTAPATTLNAIFKD